MLSGFLCQISSQSKLASSFKHDIVTSARRAPGDDKLWQACVGTFSEKETQFSTIL